MMIKIGVSACIMPRDPLRNLFKNKVLLYAEESLMHWAMSIGALCYLIPTVLNNTPSISALLQEMDGLIIQGGADVAPESYGDVPLSSDWAGDRNRDIYETTLIQEAMKQNKPILGICRGLHIINVALGGTLYQDLSSCVPKANLHRDWDLYDELIHDIKIKQGGKLSQLYPNITNNVKVNSIHHQGIKTLGRSLIVDAESSKDGIIEAVYLENNNDLSQPYVFAVQWHPEFQSNSNISILNPQPIISDFYNQITLRKKKRLTL